MKRADRRKVSNNQANPNQNICAQTVCAAFGVASEVRYLHTMNDVVRAVRKRYTVRSRRSSVKGATVGAIRGQLPKVAENAPGRVLGFLVQVPGHVLALDPQGRTVVDTAPRKRDKRRVLSLYVVYDERAPLPGGISPIARVADLTPSQVRAIIEAQG